MSAQPKAKPTGYPKAERQEQAWRKRRQQTPPFDTLRHARQLERANVPPGQADAITNALTDAVSDLPTRTELQASISNLASKDDLRALETRLRADLASKDDLRALETRLRADLASKDDLRALETRLRADLASKDDLKALEARQQERLEASETRQQQGLDKLEARQQKTLEDKLNGLEARMIASQRKSENRLLLLGVAGFAAVIGLLLKIAEII